MAMKKIGRKKGKWVLIRTVKIKRKLTKNELKKLINKKFRSNKIS